MITIRIAGLCIGLATETPYVLRQCDRFLTDDAPDFTVRATAEEIAAEQAISPVADATAEFVCLYRRIAEQLPAYDRFLLHGATIQVDGKAYIFTAKSGTGKSTHISLWRRRYGDAVQIVNGDKPILWRRGGTWLACGTPWCGKEGLTSTDCVEVGGLCLLERAEQNFIRPATPQEIIAAVFHQIYRPQDAGRLTAFLSLFDSFLCAVPIWRMGCNMEPEAAELAHDTMLRQTAEKTPITSGQAG